MDANLILRILFVIAIARLAYVETKLYKMDKSARPTKYFVCIGYILLALVLLFAIYKVFFMR
ncbi:MULTISPECIES: hypothetical protein [unclassified Parvimonas]|uniref:hypothetical protein n=1 Tax=unclassified Parvimonas TaxID=1151464 RepID=UPI002B46B4FE|nr:MULTISPECIES: hypothetical protein [unclassified Parvimonas]MEB3024875.1 hypothetical protein [Parvimonas sp. M13]MEB3073066.1 hypothetical protein [Parvimonas sp. C2]MEB3088979.1 hypothetical protein [Parvimonas sp. M20]